jgi:hypothetical protein
MQQSSSIDDHRLEDKQMYRSPTREGRVEDGFSFSPAEVSHLDAGSHAQMQEQLDRLAMEIKSEVGRDQGAQGTGVGEPDADAVEDVYMSPVQRQEAKRRGVEEGRRERMVSAELSIKATGGAEEGMGDTEGDARGLGGFGGTGDFGGAGGTGGGGGGLLTGGSVKERFERAQQSHALAEETRLDKIRNSASRRAPIESGSNQAKRDLWQGTGGQGALFGASASEARAETRGALTPPRY